MPFKVEEHTVHIPDESIDSVVQPAYEFFIKSPLHSLNALPDFTGAGVYALYLTDIDKTPYKEHLLKSDPIYVGKAALSGSRQGRSTKVGKKLRDRLQKHRRSIEEVENIDVDQFYCRFMIMAGRSTDMIGAMESYLIRKFYPLWNSYIDGFGINAPGKGRYNQSPSEWDTLHPGRYYAAQLTGKPRDIGMIREKIVEYSTQKKTGSKSQIDLGL